MCIPQCIDFSQHGRVIKEKLFKYFPLRDYHIKAFLNNHMFLAFPSRLNDCYDTSDLLIDPFPKFKKICGWCPEKAKRLDQHGICSFIEASDVKNGWMWSFYANNYNGFAIEYDPHLFDEYPPLLLMPIKYLDKALNLDDEQLCFRFHEDEIITIDDFKNGNSKFLDRAFQCLHLEKNRQLWEKENEWRVMLGEIRSQKIRENLTDHQDGYFLNISKLAYKALFIGYKVQEEYRKILTCIAKNKGMSVCLVTPKLINCQWDMEIKEI